MVYIFGVFDVVDVAAADGADDSAMDNPASLSYDGRHYDAV
jgi:hypothetical protein